jgi:hypothetical protein
MLMHMAKFGVLAIAMLVAACSSDGKTTPDGTPGPHDLVHCVGAPSGYKCEFACADVTHNAEPNIPCTINAGQLMAGTMSNTSFVIDGITGTCFVKDSSGPQIETVFAECTR